MSLSWNRAQIVPLQWGLYTSLFLTFGEVNTAQNTCKILIWRSAGGGKILGNLDYWLYCWRRFTKSQPCYFFAINCIHVTLNTVLKQIEILHSDKKNYLYTKIGIPLFEMIILWCLVILIDHMILKISLLPHQHFYILQHDDCLADVEFYIIVSRIRSTWELKFDWNISLQILTTLPQFYTFLLDRNWWQKWY